GRAPRSTRRASARPLPRGVPLLFPPARGTTVPACRAAVRHSVVRSGEKTVQSTVVVAPRAATQSAGRTPYAVPIAPPASAPSALTPWVTVDIDVLTRPRIASGTSVT